jgi:methylmalonyl-CoA mutase
MILREEAYFDRVTDPASGSYYIESLTDSVGEKAWDLFRETESRGGFTKAFESGWIQEKVLASRKKKLERAASGRDHILGTNVFPDFHEMILSNLKDLPEPITDDAPLTPVSSFRISSIYEEVRLETEQSSKRPRVFLLKHGNPAWAAARATFSGNFFACAGYEIIDKPASISLAETIKSARDAEVDMVVICSSDDAYGELVPQVNRELGERSVIVVAGYPADILDDLRRQGIGHFIHMRSNHLEILKEFNRMMLQT